MEFNVLQDPPRHSEIKNQIKRNKIYAALSVIVGIPLTIFGFFWLSNDNPDSVYLLFAGSFIIVLGFYNQINKNSKLSNISDMYCDTALRLCDKHIELEKYRKKVVALNRSLTNAEYQMIVDWDKKTTQQAAFHRLHCK